MILGPRSPARRCRQKVYILYIHSRLWARVYDSIITSLVGTQYYIYTKRYSMCGTISGEQRAKPSPGGHEDSVSGVRVCLRAFGQAQGDLMGISRHEHRAHMCLFTRICRTSLTGMAARRFLRGTSHRTTTDDVVAPWGVPRTNRRAAMPARDVPQM